MSKLISNTRTGCQSPRALVGRRHWRTLLCSTALTTGALFCGALNPALADCSNTGTFPSITAFSCTGSDTDGHAIGTFTFAPATGNTSDITSSMAAAASLSNAAGSSALAVALDSGADWSFTALDPFNQIQSVNAAAVRFGTIAANSVITHDIAGQITALNGTAVYGYSSAGSTINLTYESTAIVTATGTGHFFGLPTAGAGVALFNNTGTVDWRVTNHGQFRTENDAIVMYNLSGGGTHTIVNDGTIGTAVQPSGGAGAFIYAPSSSATGVINNDGGFVYATGNGRLGDVGGLAVITGGNATIHNNMMESVGGYVQTTYDPGILALSRYGNAVVDGQYGTVISTNGVGIAAVALGDGDATVTAGDTSAGSAALSVPGYFLPSIFVPFVGPLTKSGGVLAIANGTGDASATAYGDVSVDGGNFGVAAISRFGAATTTLDGATIDPPAIGSAAIVLGGSSDATVTATDSTIHATNYGVLAVNTGTGKTVVSLTDTTIGDGTAPNTPATGVFALSTGGGAVSITASGSNIQATGNGVAVTKLGSGDSTVDGTNHVVVSNDNSGGDFGTTGVINAPTGAGVTVYAVGPWFGDPNNVLISNNHRAQIIGAGGFLTGAVNVYADGDVTVENRRGSQLTNVIGTSGMAVNVFTAGDIAVTNDRGANITGNMWLNSITGSVTVENKTGGSWDFSGFSRLSAAVDVSLTNSRGGEITGTNAFLGLFAGHDASITNTRGASLDLNGISTNLMSAGNNATITNDRGGSFTMTGLSSNLIFAGNDASITNDRGGSFSLIGLTNNTIVAGDDVSISNSRGASFNIFGLSGQFISAGQDATITNQRGADLYLAGLTGTFITAGRDATITNERGGNIYLEGVNLLAINADRDATIDNKTGGSIVLEGFNTIALNAGLGGSTINNSTGAQIVTYGVANFLLSGSEINNSSNGGDNNQVCDSLPGICVNGLATFSGTGGSQLQFNNSGGLVSMINGWSGYDTGLVAMGYGTYIGDVTVINGNFNASGTSQLAIDARLGGPGLDSAADLLAITNTNNTGAVTGASGIIVANGNNPGQYNPVGIPVVTVDSGSTLASNFFIDPQSNYYKTINGIGVIDKGLFFYGLTTMPDPNTLGGVDHVLVGLPDQEAFQLTYAATGAQNVWYDTAIGWLDRQGDLRSYVDGRRRIRASVGEDGADMPGAPAARSSAGYGAWIKATGSWTNMNAHREIAGYDQYSFNTGFKQNTYSIIAGVDGGRDGVLHAGDTFVGSLMGGYVSSDLQFKQSSNKFTYSGGVFGVSGSYMSNGWFFDSVFQADFLRLSVNMPSIALFGPSTDAADVTNLGGMASFGYRFDRGDYYFEPAATVAYVRTSIDNISLQGIGVTWGDTTSFRGALGARLGARVQQGNYLIDTFLTGRVWDEWQGADSATFLTTGPALDLNGGTPKGVYGEVSGLVNVANMTNGWSSFLGGSVKFADSFTTVSAKGGVLYHW